LCDRGYAKQQQSNNSDNGAHHTHTDPRTTASGSLAWSDPGLRPPMDPPRRNAASSCVEQLKRWGRERMKTKGKGRTKGTGVVCVCVCGLPDPSD